MMFSINKWIRWLPVILITCMGFSLNNIHRHPFHVSATEMEYNMKDKKIEISSKIFTDDLEAVLSKLYKTKVDFSDPALKDTMNGLVKRYITTHVSVRTDGKLLPLELYGWEINFEAIYIYTTAAANVFNGKNIAVENTILYDQFRDQMNIIHFIINKQRKSIELNYPERNASFSFNAN